MYLYELLICLLNYNYYLNEYRNTISLLVFYNTFLLSICHSNIHKIKERKKGIPIQLIRREIKNCIICIFILNQGIYLYSKFSIVQVYIDTIL